MALREVTVDGAQWVVWAVKPAPRTGAPVVRPDMMEGWLAAKSGNKRCRIIPVPEGWQNWPDHQLAEAVRDAASQLP